VPRSARSWSGDAVPRATGASGPRREVRAFAPGRVNLIGEHTDYNGGLALPFAIAEGVAVQGRIHSDEPLIRIRALDLGEEDRFSPAAPARTTGWRAFARGIATELAVLGIEIPGAELDIHGDLPRGAGLSSSAALEVALALALLGLAEADLDRRDLARLCTRVENEWAGAHTGLLDQLASLFGEVDTALRLDFTSLEIEPVPLALGGGWRLAIVDSGERHELAASGYNERRAECAMACELLGVGSLRELERRASPAVAISQLPATLARRVNHVLDENARVLATAAALQAKDLSRVGALLDDSHASLREQYECSTPAVEATVGRLRDAGAAGVRMIGGGFGGSVLALFAPGVRLPVDARQVSPSRGAFLTSETSEA
jgi:galactokinase